MSAYKVKVSLKYAKPAVYRTLIIPPNTPLTDVTDAINLHFGWCGYHLHEYTLGRIRIMTKDSMDFVDAESEEDLTFDNVASSDLTYIYDFGDCWVHTFRFLKPVDKYNTNRITLADFKGENPIEDCGGVRALNYIREVLSNPDDPEYDEYYEMYGDY